MEQAWQGLEVIQGRIREWRVDTEGIRVAQDMEEGEEDMQGLRVQEMIKNRVTQSLLVEIGEFRSGLLWFCVLLLFFEILSFVFHPTSLRRRFCVSAFSMWSFCPRWALERAAYFPLHRSHVCAFNVLSCFPPFVAFSFGSFPLEVKTLTFQRFN
jgi:hypothetical protein